MTLVAFQREEIFGRVTEGDVALSALGEIAREEWFKTAQLRSNVELHEDEFVVMPNHVHGVIWITPSVGAERSAPTKPPHVESGSLDTIVRAYKAAVTYAINAIQHTRGAAVWQRNYYEHIIRSEADFEHIWWYIDHNPAKWEEDELHPGPGARRAPGQNPT